MDEKDPIMQYSCHSSLGYQCWLDMTHLSHFLLSRAFPSCPCNVFQHSLPQPNTIFEKNISEKETRHVKNFFRMIVDGQLLDRRGFCSKKDPIAKMTYTHAALQPHHDLLWSWLCSFLDGAHPLRVKIIFSPGALYAGHFSVKFPRIVLFLYLSNQRHYLDKIAKSFKCQL